MNKFKLSCIIERVRVLLDMTESFITSGELDGKPEKRLDAAIIGIEAAMKEIEKAEQEIAA